jgi:hypothetical protein
MEIEREDSVRTSSNKVMDMPDKSNDAIHGKDTGLELLDINSAAKFEMGESEETAIKP